MRLIFKIKLTSNFSEDFKHELPREAVKKHLPQISCYPLNHFIHILQTSPVEGPKNLTIGSDNLQRVPENLTHFVFVMSIGIVNL